MIVSPLEILDTILPKGEVTRILYVSLPVGFICLAVARSLMEVPKKLPEGHV